MLRQKEMQQLSFCRILLFGFLLLFVYLINSNVPAESREIARPIDFGTNGIRFRITVSLKADPTFSYATQSDDPAKASLAIKVRISAHARESQFFGTVTAKASDFSLIDGVPQQVIWQDANCHQRRGLPKETVMSIDGSITTTRAKISVHARPRHLGLLLPEDEITQGIRLPDGIDNDGSFIAYRSQSKLSHLFVDVRIYTLSCELKGR